MMLACKRHALEIFKYAISRAQPDVLVRSILKVDDGKILVSNKSYSIKEKTVHLVGVGKAAMGMATTVQDILHDSLVDGIILVPCGTISTYEKEGRTNLLPKSGGKIKVFKGAKNNLPDIDAVNATKEILDYVKQMNENNLLITLISGGASALLCSPVSPVTLEEKRLIIQLLTSCGADIRELNIVRKLLSSTKGGKLGDIAFPAQVISLILSDVIGDPLDIIGSGPTVRNTSLNSNEALSIIDKYHLNGVSPTSVMQVLKKPKSNQIVSNLDHVDNYLIGNNAIVVEAAVRKASEQGYTTHVLSSTICGNAESLGKVYAQLYRFLVDERLNLKSQICASELANKLSRHGIDAKELQKLVRTAKLCDKLAVISGGETVVNVVGTGKGGRNQEMALSCCIGLKEAFHQTNDSPEDMVFLSAGTDGFDGPTEAAGAVAYIGQAGKALEYNVNPYEYLLNNDSNGFFNISKPDDLVITGFTGTNFMDLHLLLVNFKPIAM